VSPAAVGCALAIAACGSSGGSGPGTGTTAADSGYQAALRFATCMRSHRVSNFPDPTAGNGPAVGLSSGIDKRSPAFRSAVARCGSLEPKSEPGRPIPAVQRTRFIALAQCMRTHGVPNFPDPIFPATGGAEIAAPNGLDPRSPAFQAASRACAGQFPKRGRRVANGRPVAAGRGQTGG
jgi:hypothetical protein